MKSFSYRAGLGGWYSTGAGGVSLGNCPAFLPQGTESCHATLDGAQWDTAIAFGTTIRELDGGEKEALGLLWDALDILQQPAPKYAVDAHGVFVGGVHDLTGLTEVPSAPPTPDHLWTAGAWTLPVDLAVLKDDLQTRVDRTAGAARARYITVAPGQEATYVVKAQQALAFLADPTGDVPAYIVAEAEATGMTAVDAANLINNTATAWNDQLGPRIEQCRRAGNLAVAAATTIVEAQAAADSFIAQLEGI